MKKHPVVPRSSKKILAIGAILLCVELAVIAYAYAQRKLPDDRLLVASPVPSAQPLPSPAAIPSPTASVAATLRPAKRPTAVPSPKPQESQAPWGVAVQLDEVTWRMKVGHDERIGTPQEIHQALNAYRQRHGAGYLTWDDTLAKFAQERATHLNAIKSTDKHQGFKDYTSNEENLKKLGFWSVGENISYGYQLSGVHLIEWIFAGDEPHDKNQRETSWSHVGIGVSGLGVAIIFGGWKI